MAGHDGTLPQIIGISHWRTLSISMARNPLKATLLTAAMLAGPAVVHADTLRGFSAVDRPYLVGADKVCTPLLVANAVATGTPQCRTLPVDQVAKLDFGPGTVESGGNGKLKATIAGAKLTVSEGDALLVTWQANDPLGKVVAIERSKFSDRIAVTYTARRLGREMTDVVGFDLIKSSKPVGPVGPVVGQDPTTPPEPAAVASLSDASQKVVTFARTLSGKRAIKAWLIVLSDEPNFAEARFGVAKAFAQTKDNNNAIINLEQLRKSPAPDAIEWLVAARFDSAFAKLRGDAKFRLAVGLDTTISHIAPGPYERVMGFGGSWEQTGTSCDTPTVSLKLTQDRKFNLTVRSACEGMVSNSKYKGTWQTTTGSKPAVRLTLPNKDRAAEVITCEFVAKGEEEALQCPLDEDLILTVLPVRR